MINKQAQIFNSITPLDSSPGNYFWQEIEKKNNLQRLYQTVKNFSLKMTDNISGMFLVTLHHVDPIENGNTAAQLPLATLRKLEHHLHR